MARLTIALLAGVLLSTPAYATWTLTQVKGNSSCSGTTCAVTVTSTGAGHALVAGLINFSSSASTISSVTAAACSSTWTHAPNSNGGTSSTAGWVDLFYCTNSASGQTSITITSSQSLTSGVAVIWEASSSLGNIAIDSGATPSQHVNDTSCTSCTGVSLTLSGNNDFIAALGACQNTGTGLTGAGFTNDLANLGGDNEGHGITSGSVTAPATFTQNSSGGMAIDAVALQESSGGGGGKKCTLSLMGAGPC